MGLGIRLGAVAVMRLGGTGLVTIGGDCSCNSV